MTKVAPYPQCTGCKCRIDAPYCRFVNGFRKLSHVTTKAGGNGDACASPWRSNEIMGENPLHYKQYSMEALTLLAMARVPVGAVTSINQYSYAKLVMGALGMAGSNVKVVV